MQPDPNSRGTYVIAKVRNHSTTVVVKPSIPPGSVKLVVLGQLKSEPSAILLSSSRAERSVRGIRDLTWLHDAGVPIPLLKKGRRFLNHARPPRLVHTIVPAFDQLAGRACTGFLRLVPAFVLACEARFESNEPLYNGSLACDRVLDK